MKTPKILKFPGKYHEEQSNVPNDQETEQPEAETLTLNAVTHEFKISGQPKVKKFPEPEIETLEDFMECQEEIKNIGTDKVYIYNDMVLNYDSLSGKSQRYIDDYYKLKPLFENCDLKNEFGTFDQEKVREHLITFYEEYFHDLGRDGFIYLIIRPILKPLPKMKRTVFNTNAFCGHLREMLNGLESDNSENYLQVLGTLNEKDIRIRHLKKYILQDFRQSKRYFAEKSG